MINCYYDLLSTIQFNKDVPAREVQSDLSDLINSCMLFDEQLKELHHQNRFKFYSFCAPYPLEPDRIYRKGRLYCFHLRTPNMKFALKMKQYLPKAKRNIKVISTELKNYAFKAISELTTLTPIICTIDNRCWLQEDGIGLLAERLHVNALKKYQGIYSDFTAPEELFFEHIQLLNQKPICISYKGKNAILLGHKICLRVKPRPWAQQMAFIVLAAGLAEKNSLGCGYCIERR